jgi:hypothetical protein
MEGEPMSIKTMLEHQRAFNKQVWDPDGKSATEVIDRLRHLVFGEIEESLEFMKTYDFKVHRRQKLRMQNVAHSHEELIDMYKYWLSLVDTANFPIDKLEEMYYAKSAVVQYRFQEEWLKQIDRPVVIVDIDQVLADYISGICKWGREWGPKLMDMSLPTIHRFVNRLNTIEREGSWVNAETVGVPHLEWQKVKHDFRTRGGKRDLPVFPDVRPFLDWCHDRKWIIILVTSRPIVEYPNLFTDTLWWLDHNQLKYDLVWWSMEKAERLEEAALPKEQIVFAVDDSPRFVNQLREKGIKTYHLDRSLAFNESDPTTDPLHVRSLHDLMARESKGLDIREELNRG